MNLVLCFISTFFLLQVLGDVDNKEVFAWKNITYTKIYGKGNKVYPTEDDFILGNSIPTNFAYHSAEDKIFVAVPRIFKGVPHTVTEILVKKHKLGSSPPLSPFTGRPTKQLVNVFTTVIDDCKEPRLWMMDVDQVEYEDHEGKYENRSVNIVAFALEEPDYPEIVRFEVPNDLVVEPLSFGGFTVDVLNPDSGCDQTYLYITNIDESSMYVFDYKKKEIRKFSHESFKPDGSSYHQRHKFGLFAVALGHRDENGNRPAYYIPGRSTKLWMINTKILKDANFEFNPSLIGDRGPNTEAETMAFDPDTKVLFFGESNSGRISCWNTKKPFNVENTDVVNKNENMIFITALFVDVKGDLWFMAYTDNPLIDAAKIPSEDPQFRIMKMNSKSAIKGTKCE
ncbi:hypothetical protein DMENIID0001_103670 [Sergentomyia squamirostris]